MADYGDRFETPTIIVMSIAIVVSLVAVIALNAAVHDDCTSDKYTYCGEAPAHH